jgi:hypothetical protein
MAKKNDIVNSFLSKKQHAQKGFFFYYLLPQGGVGWRAPSLTSRWAALKKRRVGLYITHQTAGAPSFTSRHAASKKQKCDGRKGWASKPPAQPKEQALGLITIVPQNTQGQRPVKRLAHLWRRAHAKPEGWVSWKNPFPLPQASAQQSGAHHKPARLRSYFFNLVFMAQPLKVFAY